MIRTLIPKKNEEKNRKYYPNMTFLKFFADKISIKIAQPNLSTVSFPIDNIVNQ